MAPSIILLKSRIAADGGAEKYAKRLAIAFHKKGCPVSLLTSGKLPKESICEILSDETLNPFSFRKVQLYDKFCQTMIPLLKANIVFGLDRNRYQTHLRASNGVHAAYLEKRKQESSFLKKISFSLNPLHSTLLNIEKSAFESPNLCKLFVNSHMVRKEILKFYSTDPKKIQVIHNGVEWQEMEKDFLAWEEKRHEIAGKLAIPSSCFHFLFVGHNYRRKGLTLLLNGLRQIEKRDFHLSVVGKDKNLPFFKGLVAQYGLEKKVKFFPSAENVRCFYQLADALVIPSFYDPFANVTVEALAMGLFVISSSNNGGSEVLTQNTGVIIDDLQDPHAFAEALKTALKTPKTKISAEYIRNSIQHLDFSLQLEQLVYETLN